MGSGYDPSMRILSRKTLRDFWEKHPDSRQPLQAWYDDVKQAGWKSPADIQNTYRNAGFLSGDRVIFNIKGNRYRLIVAVRYAHSVVYIRFVGTHEQYDRVDPETI
jgi:mRNA interferase HigB